MIMERSEAIEIPFGAFDSELKGWEYTIPEGMKARIEGNKIILEPKESEDERIREELLNVFQESEDSLYMVLTPNKRESFIAWLEKQGERDLAISEKSCKIEQNPAWSEEDEEMLKDIIQGLKATEQLIFTHDEQGKTQIQGRIDWLKSLKERVQPRQNLHPRYIEGKGIYVPIIDVVLNMRDEPKEMTWDEAKDIALSREQMFVVLYYKEEINALLEKHGGQKLEGLHWTSTQSSGATYAWVVSFYYSLVSYYSRSYGYSVRAFSAYYPES